MVGEASVGGSSEKIPLPPQVEVSPCSMKVSIFVVQPSSMEAFHTSDRTRSTVVDDLDPITVDVISYRAHKV